MALSDVKSSQKVRIDSGYFGKEAVRLADQIAALPHATLGSISETFRKGIFDIKAETYVEIGGVPFVRVGDLRTGLIDPDALARISEEAHAADHKTALVADDLILSKTAYPAAALVTLPGCNVSQDTIAVSLSADGKRRFRPAYVVTYLNSGAGRSLMGRLFQGNVQEHLGLSEAAELPIPELSLKLQIAIEQMTTAAEAARSAAKAALAQAQADLLDALGLGDWSPPEPLTYTRSAAAVAEAGRLDAEFAAPRIQVLLERLGRGGNTLDTVANVRREKFRPKPPGTFRYMEIGDLDGFGRCASTELDIADAPSRATWHVRPGDVITSTVRPIRRLSAIVDADQDGNVCSSGFVVLEPRAVSSELLMTYLRLPLIAELLHLFATASMYPALAESDLLALPMPVVDRNIDDAVRASASLAQARLAYSERLLTAAKRAVEIAIEDGEAAALAFVAKQEGADAATA